MQALQIFVLFFVMVALLSADTPPAAPGDVKVSSPNKHYFALSEVKAKRTRVFSSAKKATPLWKIPGYHSVLFVANDGTHLVTGQPEGNLLPQDVKSEHEFLNFYSNGTLVRSLRVGDVFPQLDSLPKTASHRQWGNYYGFDRLNRFVIILFDGRRIVYDPSTGQPLQP